MTLREQTEALEREMLSPFACLSSQSRGRQTPLEPCPTRTCFQRDIDRIIHSKAFRRLKHKTQVFLEPEGDHYRTRMTHTIEVSRIARTIARGLRLNEDLAEAAAYGHDLGHTPFGHAGERVLNEILPGGFAHNEQSLRVVDRLEKEGEGLNLTYEVRRGILCHTGPDRAETLEGDGFLLDGLLRAALFYGYERGCAYGVIGEAAAEGFQRQLQALGLQAGVKLRQEDLPRHCGC